MVVNMRDTGLFVGSLEVTGQEITARETLPKPGNCREQRALGKTWVCKGGGAGRAAWEEAAPRVTPEKVPSPVLRKEAATGQFRRHEWLLSFQQRVRQPQKSPLLRSLCQAMITSQEILGK